MSNLNVQELNYLAKTTPKDWNPRVGLLTSHAHSFLSAIFHLRTQ